MTRMFWPIGPGCAPAEAAKARIRIETVTNRILFFGHLTHRDLSRLPEGGGPYKVLEFTRVEVKPSMVPQFMKVVGKYHAALEKTNSPMVYAFVQPHVSSMSGKGHWSRLRSSGRSGL